MASKKQKDLEVVQKLESDTELLFQGIVASRPDAEKILRSVARWFLTDPSSAGTKKFVAEIGGTMIRARDRAGIEFAKPSQKD